MIKKIILIFMIIYPSFAFAYSINLTSPASGKILNEFNGQDMQGITIDTSGAKQLFASTSGTVFFAGNFSKFQQNMIIIKSDNYSLYTIYRNVSEFKVKSGMYVKSGQKIGKSYKRLVFEVRDLKGKAYDPLDYFRVGEKKKKKTSPDFYLKFQDFMVRNGFQPQEIPMMFCIALWESSFNRKAVNQNTNKTQDTGLFQINDVWLRECGMTRRDLFDVRNNAQCARRVLHKQGFTAWTTFNIYAQFCSV